MSAITVTGFLGASLAVDDTLLPERVGVNSINQLPGYGDLRPLPGLGDAVATVSSGMGTIWRMGQDVDDPADYWLAFADAVDLAVGFDASDSTERTYFTGAGVPSWTSKTLALSGGPPYPQTYRPLQVPAPEAAPVVTINTDGASSESSSTVSYVYTYRNDQGWESAPSPVSNELLIHSGATLDLIGFEAIPSGYFITTVVLYQVVTNDAGTADFFYLREWAVGAEPDNPIADGRAVGADTLATEGWRPPPDGGYGLKRWWLGMMAMFDADGRAVRLCEPFSPYAWPLRYEIALAHKGVAMGVYGQTALILTTGDPVKVVGTDPESMDAEPTGLNRPCVAARSVVDFNEGAAVKGVAWASREGLCWVGDAGFADLTRAVMTPEQWRAINPESIVATRWRNFYLASYEDGTSRKGFMIDPAAPTGIYFLSDGFPAMFHDGISEQVFVLDGTAIKTWAGGDPQAATFKSKVFQAPAPLVVGALEVLAKDWPVHVKLWADGALVLDREVPGPTPVRPVRRMADSWQVELSSAHRVLAVRFAATVDGLKGS